MRAGRSLDAAIAVEVFKWVPVFGDWWPGAVNPGKWNCSLDQADGFAFPYKDGGIKMPDGKTYCSTPLHEFEPSKSIEAAWTVLEKLRPLGAEVVRSALPGHKHQWVCRVWELSGDGALASSGFVASAPLAICLVALKVVRNAAGKRK